MNRLLSAARTLLCALGLLHLCASTQTAFSQMLSNQSSAVVITPSVGGPITVSPNSQITQLKKVSRVYIFGNSYDEGVGVYSYSDSYAGLLQRDTPAPILNYAVGGATTPQFATRAYSNYIPSQQFPTVSILGAAQNDAPNDGCTACANALTHYTESDSALIAWLTIPFSNRVMASAATSTTGTWTTDTNVPFPSYPFLAPGTSQQATASGASKTFTITTTTATTEIGINYLVCNNGNGACGSFTVSIDGTNVVDACSGTTTFSSTSCVAFYGGQTTGVYRQEYTVTPATSHTIVYTTASAGYSIISSVDWIVPNAATNNTVFQFSTPSTWTNYAAYNTAQATLLAAFRSHGINAFLADDAGGVTVPGGTAYTVGGAYLGVVSALAGGGGPFLVNSFGATYAVNPATDFATTATATCSAAQLANHPNTCGMEDLREVLQAAEIVNHWQFSSPNLVAGPSSSESLSFPALISGRVSQASNGQTGQITAAATVALTGSYAYGGDVHITGSTTVTTLTPPTLCQRTLTFCLVNFVADSTVNFGTGGNINSNATLPSGQSGMMLFEQPNPNVATGKWYPLFSNSFVGSFTSTAATTDTFTLTGVTSSSHCSLTATNAAAVTGGYAGITTKATNSITVTHAATAGMTYDAICTPF